MFLTVSVVFHCNICPFSLPVVIQVFGLIVSLLTMAWSLVSFQAALRSSLPDKAEMNWVGKCLMFLWRLMTLSARVIAIALFASYFTFYVFAFLGGHFIFMFFWMAKQKTSYCMVQVLRERMGGTELKDIR